MVKMGIAEGTEGDLGRGVGTEPEESPYILQNLSAEDKLTYRTLEAEFYRDQLQLQNIQQQAQKRLEAINAFVTTLHQKYNRDQKEWAIDRESLDFVEMKAK